MTYSTGNESGDEDFRKAAQTRANEIKASQGFNPKADTVLLAGVGSKMDFKNVINQANGMEKQFGKVGEVDLFIHSGGVDGPTFNEGYNRPGGPHYKNEQDMGAFLSMKVNWAANAVAGFYGCNTALAISSDFAQQFADAQRVPTWGFNGPMNFSSSPNSISLFDYFYIGDKEYAVHHSGAGPVQRKPK